MKSSYNVAGYTLKIGKNEHKDYFSALGDSRVCI